MAINDNYYIDDYSSLDLEQDFGVDRDGTFEDAANCFDMSIEELDKTLAGKNVLDLGSGPGLLAKRCYIKKVKDPNYEPPRKVESMNIRFNDPNYRDKYLNRPPIQIEVGEDNYPIPTLGTNGIDDGEIKSAIEEAERNFSSLDWNDLKKIQPNLYDVIISNNGFPYYSDFRVLSIMGKKKYEKADIILSDNDLEVFKGIAHVLKPGGTAYLTTFPGVHKAAWDFSNSKNKKVLVDALKRMGCIMSFEENSISNAKPLENMLVIKKLVSLP